jgi:predicted amidohydrolase
MKKEKLTLSAVQFNAHQTDKVLNLQNMEGFIQSAAEKGVDVISFPEICITGYRFLSGFSQKSDLLEIAEYVPDGKSVQRVVELANQYQIVILFGLLEKDHADNLYNTYVCVTPQGLVHTYRKLHAFENEHILSGDEFVIFDIYGWKCGILICFDNNLPENPRIYALKGCEILFAPHQTGGFDMEVDGMGLIDPQLWLDRNLRESELRAEFSGPKGRQWIMKWLPSRAYDNNMFYVFTNGVGEDGGGIRTGNAMILDPNGAILAESTAITSDLITAVLTKKSLSQTLGKMHISTRRADLYGELTDSSHPSISVRIARDSLISDLKK